MFWCRVENLRRLGFCSRVKIDEDVGDFDNFVFLCMLLIVSSWNKYGSIFALSTVWRPKCSVLMLPLKKLKWHLALAPKKRK